ncbi:coiled-coil domain-containing protein 192 isoform X3 [Mustela erminea]|uniref:coiled-coil domain-containing protein 192 isoform X3 n=1 Tax=Mustela erminea TaxID=36723 RepID=UPI001386FD65|nr:coiled-coil domain-containing protein 192 isoform X3 [Mustela erminea]
MGECYSKKSVAPGSETLERISTTSTSSESNIQQRNKKPKESLETGQMAFTLAQLEALEICLKEAEEKAKSLSEQLAASEGTKAKLLEQVSWLEEKLETLNHKEDSGEPYEKMVLAKDQCIEKLQAEVKASQEQLTAHKLKHKRKLKKLQTDLATAKQEAAITVLELNEKIRTLCEGKPAPRDEKNGPRKPSLHSAGAGRHQPSNAQTMDFRATQNWSEPSLVTQTSPLLSLTLISSATTWE